MGFFENRNNTSFSSSSRPTNLKDAILVLFKKSPNRRFDRATIKKIVSREYSGISTTYTYLKKCLATLVREGAIEQVGYNPEVYVLYGHGNNIINSLSKHELDSFLEKHMGKIFEFRYNGKNKDWRRVRAIIQNEKYFYTDDLDSHGAFIYYAKEKVLEVRETLLSTK